MSQATLEDRVTDLESRMDQFAARLSKPTVGKNWRDTLGMFSGNEAMKRIDAAALQYREADRASGKRDAEAAQAQQHQGRVDHEARAQGSAGKTGELVL